MDPFDFLVVQVNNVVERPPTYHWQASNLCFPNNHVLVFSLAGRANYVINGVTTPTKENDAFLFPPGHVRSGSSNPDFPWHFISVNFDLHFPGGQVDHFHKTLFLINDVSEHIRASFKRVSTIWGEKGPFYQIKCRNLISDILCGLLTDQTTPEPIPHFGRLEQARKHIQQNFTQELRIKAIAEEQRLSESHFRKLFTQAYSVSPMQYIMQLRLGKAQDLLRSGEVNITETAHLCGFTDIYYFSALFRKKTGLSPKKFIENSMRR